MPERFHRRIIDHLADPRYRPRKIEELAETLGIDQAELESFETAVRKLLDDGQVILGQADTIGLPPPGREMEGTFRLNPRGFGFIVPDNALEHGDLFVPQGNTADAMTGDRVRAKVLHDRRRAGEGRSPYIGRIVQIIQRADKHYVGNLSQQGGRWLVKVDGQSLPDPVIIRDPHAKNAKAGDKVVIELTQYPEDDRPAEGVILEVLGEQGQPDVETQATMRAFGLKEGFPPNCMDEARAAARAFDDRTVPPDRVDLTGEFILTIDPPDAKDFDDAISISRINEGDAVWELGVHIAHVAHFVRQGGALDKEATHRGNSTYLPRKVVPMLPEMLSNGVCSLQEGVNRFCLSAFIRYDAAGKVVGERFARTVIRSAKRLTYLEAQALIDGDLREAKKHAKTEPKYGGPLLDKLRQMDELSKAIRKRRFDEGMIVLDLPEVELVFDDSGRVVDAQPEDDAYTHKLIEMFMVEANEAAARLFHRLDVAMIRRIHPDPDAHDVGELRNFARVAGFNIPMRPSRRELQQLLDAVRGKPAQRAVHIAVLRTLSKAEYSPMIIGHFALASEHYTHFTSPIRRYPDLIVHRGLDAYLDATATASHGHDGAAKHRDAHPGLSRAVSDDPRVPREEQLHEIARRCSTTERNSESAERDLRTYLVLELLAEHLGDDFDGTVTGITGGGIFVQLDKYLVDGFVRIGDLPWRGERWRLNPNTGMLVAQGSGKTISIGNTFTVRIAKVDPVARRLELAIIPASADGKAAVSPGKHKKRTQPPGARKAQDQTMRIKRDKSSKKNRNKKRRS
jgi:ribonuclease R